MVKGGQVRIGHTARAGMGDISRGWVCEHVYGWVWEGGKFLHVWARVGKGGPVWMGLTDWAVIGDIPSGWEWVCLQV